MNDPLQKLREMEGVLPDPELPPELATRVFEDNPDAVIIVNDQSIIKFVNKQAEFLFGYHRSELFNKNVDVLVPEDIRDRHVHHRTAFMDNPSVRPMGRDIKLHGQRKNGQQFEAEINLSPVPTKQGFFVVAVVRKKR